MEFSDRIRIENDVYHPYKPYGSTSCVTPTTPRDVIYIPSDLNVVRFSDRIRMENGPFHLYKPYGSTRSFAYLSLLRLESYSKSL